MHYATADALRARIVAVATARNAPQERTEDYVHADLSAVVADIVSGADPAEHGGFTVEMTLSQLAEVLDRHARPMCGFDPQRYGGEGGMCRRTATHAVWLRRDRSGHPVLAFCDQHTPVVLAARKVAGFEGAFAEPLTPELLTRFDAHPRLLNATFLGVFND